MLLSVKWLREMVPFEGDVDELADRLTMLGLEMEELIQPFAHLDKVVVGHVLTCDRHPEADHLSVCTVDAGQSKVLPIVCGAPNVAKGQKVPVALVGAELPGGVIKKAKLRGSVSLGMICAEDELGLGESHDGIMVLDENLPPGLPLVDALDLDLVVLDIGVTPNRADCLSILGLAREVAMAFGLPLTLPDCSVAESGPDAGELMPVEIDEPELCPVYQGRIIDNITVGPSPAWLRYRLMAVGQRPINNMVDVTNYVLFEMGQPLHSFDMDLLEGGKIRVARARDGMRFTTLDNQERVLTADDILIWDGVKPVGLAGVMGGANSEMHAGSTRVYLESAVFKPANIRKTARRLALHSEASYRFERGVDQPGSLLALNRASALMAQLGGGTVYKGLSLAEPLPWKPRNISFRPHRARKLLGVPLEDGFCLDTIKGMGCGVDASHEGAWSIDVPSHRLDLEREVDITEELGRVYGMDRIQATLPRVSRPLEGPANQDATYDTNMAFKRWAAGLGLCEAVNYSFVGHKDLDLLGLPQDNRVPVMNPLSEDQNVLRTALAPGLLNNLRHNIAQGNDRLKLFEVARLFTGRPHVRHHGPRTRPTGPAPVRRPQPRGLALAPGRRGLPGPEGPGPTPAGHPPAPGPHLLQGGRHPLAGPLRGRARGRTRPGPPGPRAPGHGRRVPRPQGRLARRTGHGPAHGLDGPNRHSVPRPAHVPARAPGHHPGHASVPAGRRPAPGHPGQRLQPAQGRGARERVYPGQRRRRTQHHLPAHLPPREQDLEGQGSGQGHEQAHDILDQIPAREPAVSRGRPPRSVHDASVIPPRGTMRSIRLVM